MRVESEGVKFTKPKSKSWLVLVDKVPETLPLDGVGIGVVEAVAEVRGWAVRGFVEEEEEVGLVEEWVWREREGGWVWDPLLLLRWRPYPFARVGVVAVDAFVLPLPLLLPLPLPLEVGMVLPFGGEEAECRFRNPCVRFNAPADRGERREDLLGVFDTVDR